MNIQLFPKFLQFWEFIPNLVHELETLSHVLKDAF